MNETREILEKLVSGELTIGDAEKQLRILAVEKIGSIASFDVDRQTRTGIPEIVFAESKNAMDVVSIVQRILETHKVVLVTRLDDEKVEVLKDSIKDSKMAWYGREPVITALIHKKEWIPKDPDGRIAIITAGTSDIPYANEAEVLAKLMGVEVISYYDVGVSGIHRLIEPIKDIIDMEVDALIVFAGMEGALPTVVASLVDIPVIGVPVPTGYGYGGKGETALASMLQSCSPGLAVVNIGNGIGAASIACLISKRVSSYRKRV